MGLRERKIFRVLLVIQIILVLPMTLIALAKAITNHSLPEFEFILLSGLFLLFGLNDVYILYAVNVVKKVTGANPVNRTPHIISSVLNMLGLAAIIVFFCYGFHEEFFREGRSYDNTGKLVLLYLLFIILIGISIAIMQVRLIKAFSKLSKKEMEDQITHIGNSVE